MSKLQLNVALSTVLSLSNSKTLSPYLCIHKIYTHSTQIQTLYIHISPHFNRWYTISLFFLKIKIKLFLMGTFIWILRYFLCFFIFYAFIKFFFFRCMSWNIYCVLFNWKKSRVTFFSVHLIVPEFWIYKVSVKTLLVHLINWFLTLQMDLIRFIFRYRH